MQSRGKIPARYALAILFLVTVSITSAAQGVVSFRNNILWDATGTPNLGAEFSVSKHFTVGLNAAFKPWPRFLAWDNDPDNNARWRHLTLAPELRYYPKQAGRPGWFYGANFVYSHFNLGQFNIPLGPYADLQTHRQQGDFYGGTAFGGHMWSLTKHLRVEVVVGLGAGWNEAKRYECAHCGAELGDVRGVSIIPKAGVNLVLSLDTRRRLRREINSAVLDLTPRSDTLALSDIGVIRDTIVRTPPKVDTTVATVPPVEPEPEPTPAPEPARVERHPLLRHISDYQAYTPDRVLSREDGCIPVWFQFAKADLLRSVYVRGYERDNGAGLDSLVDVVNDLLGDTTVVPAKVQIVGFASIDGPVAPNEQLARQRARAVKSHIKWKTGLPEEVFELVCGGEAWSELLDELAQRHAAGESRLTDDEYARVLKIVADEDDLDMREYRLKTADGGSIYERLRQTLFADQRSAVCVRVYYDDAPAENTQIETEDNNE